MRSYEFSAKSVDKAIKLGLETLNKKQEEVDIKIISEGGFFKKAKIVINIEDKPEITNFRKEQPKTDVQKAEVKNEQKEINKKSTFEKTNESTVSKQDMPKESVSKAEQTENKQQAETKDDCNNKQAKAEQENAVKQDKTEVQNTANIQHTEQKVLKNNETSVEFVKGLLSAMNLVADVNLKETKDNSQVTIEIEDAGSVIGYRGECLSAIQYLANVVEQKHNKNAKRVVVDAGDYKKKREQQLRDLAIKVAGKVEATGRPHKFEPMNAYERRIIHTELQNYSSVETHSEGEEPHRRLIVTKKAK